MSEPAGVIAGLLEELTKLPGIGPKSAERIAHFLLAGDRRNAVAPGRRADGPLPTRFARAASASTSPTRELCPVCRDPRRDAGLICVVETPRDVNSFERAGNFRGLYHVLGGRLAPLDGMGPEQLTFPALVERVRRGGVREVILATSPTLEGDGTALFASNVLAPTGCRDHAIGTRVA